VTREEELAQLIEAQQLDDGRARTGETQMHRRVHPNSTAARKWNRTTWTPTQALFARASRAKKEGQAQRAEALRRAAGRAAAKSHHCG